MYLIAFQPKTPGKKGRKSNSFEELEASGSSETTFHLHSPFEELEASGSSETTFHPQSPFEELEASGSSSTTLHGSPETLAHSSPLQPLSHSKLIPITP